jgi:WS/DGAT/MGAT family acyltransferase
MQRLSGFDAAFWFGETYQSPLHGAGLMVFDVSAAPNFSFDVFRERIASRLPKLPPLSYRVAGHRFGIDRPWFVEDPMVDVGYQVRRIAAPAPGGRRELEKLVGHLVSHPLDRRKPLWELWFIEGLAQDRVAILAKIHHALVDGETASVLFEAIFDNFAQLELPAVAESSCIPRLGQRALSALFNLAVVTPYRSVQLVRQALAKWRAVRGLADAPPKLFGAPKTRFNTEISTRRRVSGSRRGVHLIAAVRRFADVPKRRTDGAFDLPMITLPSTRTTVDQRHGYRSHELTTWGSKPIHTTMTRQWPRATHSS